MENQEIEKKMMSIVAEDGSIEEVEVILAFEFKDTGKEYVVYTKNEKDANGNATIGNNIQMIDSKNNIVHTLNEKKVVIQGLEGYIIAEENGTLLICKMSEEQNIKFFSGMN